MDATTVYLHTDDGGLVPMTRQTYASEAELQEFVAKNPVLLTAGLADRRYLLVKREMDVPDREASSGRWSLDHLFVDDQGIPTLIEVKQASNREIRRMVVGQLLDHAENGTEYWPEGELHRALVARLQHESPDGDGEALAAEAVAELTGNVDPAEFWQRVESNLRSGRVRLVGLADVIPAELRRVVEFLNERMPDTEVLAMEIPQYVGEGHRTLVPSIVGRTVAAERAKRVTGRHWADYLADASPATRTVHERLTEWALARGGELSEANESMGYRAEGEFLVRLYPRDEVLEMSLSRWRGGSLSPEAQAIRQRLIEICPSGRLTMKVPYLPTSDLVQNWDVFVDEILPRYIAYVKSLPDAD